MRLLTLATPNSCSSIATLSLLQFRIPETMRTQSKSNRQASLDETHTSSTDMISQLKSQTESCVALYHEWLEKGACREQARMILPQNMYTRPRI